MSTTHCLNCPDAFLGTHRCQQAYRWNLDYIVDTHGNTMSLWYGRDTNNYARNNTARQPN